MRSIFTCYSNSHLHCSPAFAARRFHSRNALTSFFFWVKSWALPGIGMFCEVSLASLLSWSGLACHCHFSLKLTALSALQSYFIFSIGNITPIFQETYKVRA